MNSSAFERNDDLVYLNSGTHSICPREVHTSFIESYKTYERNPSDPVTGAFGIWARMWAVQKKVAHFFGADPRDLFLRDNVTQALNDFILNIPLPSDGEILVTDLEYGAIVNVCRLRAERQGLSLRTASLLRRHKSKSALDSLSEDELLSELIAELRPNTRMLMISHVFTGNGVIFPILKLAQETRKRGILLVVDGAHGPGALPLDLKNWDDVDFYAGSLHKWMMGPKGTSFGWTPKRHQKALSQPWGSWTCFEVPADFSTFGEGDSFALRMLNSATRNFAPSLALSATMDFWQNSKPASIFARLKDLQKITYSRMLEFGFEPLTPDPTHPLSGPLLSWKLGARFQAGGRKLMMDCLKATGVQIGMSFFHEEWGLRLSPHINLENERLILGLERMAGFLRG